MLSFGQRQHGVDQGPYRDAGGAFDAAVAAFGKGQWEESQFTGTGFPGDFYIKYHLYRNYWPLMALGRYRAANATNVRES